jgi:HEAT repeat protein
LAGPPDPCSNNAPANAAVPATVAALGQIRDSGSVAPLASALRDSDPGVRRDVAHALASIRTEAALDALGRALSCRRYGL